MNRPVYAAALISILFLLVAQTISSEEEYLLWQSVRIECVELEPIGKVILTAQISDGKFGSLEVTVFGRTYTLEPEKLAKLESFPLSSISITHETGYKELGGYTLTCKFNRVYYNDDKDLIQEHAYISFFKDKPKEVAVTIQSKTLNKGNEQSTATDANQHTADSIISSDNLKSNNINSEQTARLENILRSLTPEGYSFEILKDQHNPFRWSSSGAFSGITFYFDSNGPQHTKIQLPEGKELRTSVYITFMPEEYVGVSLHDNDSALQVSEIPSKYLGKYQTLQVYACSTFGYSLPKKGKLSEENLRKTIGIVWDETRCITPDTQKEIEKLVMSILPKDYTIEISGGTDPYHWTSPGTSIGVTFYLHAKIKDVEQDKNPSTTILTIMPPEYNGKPLSPKISKGIYNVGTKKYDPDVQVEILSATYLGNLNSLKFYASVGWGHPLPKKGVLSEDNIIKAFKLSVLEKNDQQRNSIDDASQRGD